MTTVSEVYMDILDAQREVRSAYIGGFKGQLVSSVIWLVSAALGTWATPKASILTVVAGGFFILLGRNKSLATKVIRLLSSFTAARRQRHYAVFQS